MMLGLECRGVTNTELIAAMLDAGLLSAPAGENVVRLLPPLIISEAQVDEAAHAVAAACEVLAQGANVAARRAG